MEKRMEYIVNMTCAYFGINW